MAISQMRRVQLFVHNSHRASLIKDLQGMEIIHINNLNQQEEPTTELPSDSEVKDNIRGMQNGHQEPFYRQDQTLEQFEWCLTACRCFVAYQVV